MASKRLPRKERVEKYWQNKLRRAEARLRLLQLFKETYPDGALPKVVADRLGVSIQPGDKEVTQRCDLWLKNNDREPFVVFEATVHLETGELTINVAKKPSEIPLDQINTDPVKPRID